MTYTINNNIEKNGIEITFDGKPSEEIRTALKANGFRWHSANHYWYGRADESTIRAILDCDAIPAAESLPTQKKKAASALPSLWERTRTDSIPEHDTRLDTKTICAEVRAHLKARFPECKFSIRKDSYNSIYARIEAAPYSRKWIPEDAEAIREYGCLPRFDAHWEDSPALAAVLAYCDAYLQSYNYDNSDTMTDYFDVNFYGEFSIVHSMDQLTPSAEILADIADFEVRAAEQAEKDAAESEEAARRAAIEAEAARIAAEENSRMLAEQAERITAAIEVRDIPEKIKTLKYAIACNGQYLQGIKPNEHYSRTGTAPTMGARHCFHEYETIWGDEFKATEPLTTVSYLKVLFEEYRWEEKEPINIEIIPYWE